MVMMMMKMINIKQFSKQMFNRVTLGVTVKSVKEIFHNASRPRISKQMLVVSRTFVVLLSKLSKKIFHKQFDKRVSTDSICECKFCQDIINKQFERKQMLEDCGMLDV